MKHFLLLSCQFFVFPRKILVKSSSFLPVDIYLTKGEIIALASAVLASIYKDLSLFKGTTDK